MITPKSPEELTFDALRAFTSPLPRKRRLLLTLVGTYGVDLHLEARKDTFLEHIKMLFCPCAYKLVHIQKHIHTLPTHTLITEAKEKIKEKLERTGKGEVPFLRLFHSLFPKKTQVYVLPPPPPSLREPATTSTTESDSISESVSITEEEEPSLPEVPQDGIKMGLPNITSTGQFGNTCWLNSVLKFIASTEDYDSMMTQELRIDKLELQRALRVVIQELRTREGTIAQALYTKLLDQIAKDFKIGKQQDAVEFLTKLTQKLEATRETKVELYPRLSQVYIPNPDAPVGIVKFGCANDTLKSDYIKLPLPPELALEPQKPIDIQQLLADRDLVEVRPEIGSDKDEKFTKVTCFTRLPNTLMIYVDRTRWDQSGKKIKIENPISLNGNGEIELIEYEHQKNERGEIMHAVEKKRIFYRVDASLLHLGGAKGGHYVCEERAQNGGASLHSDAQLSAIANPAAIGTYGTFLRLKKVREEPL